MFNKNTTQILDRLFFNLPAVVFSTTIAIRILIAIPVALVSIQKFEFFGNVWVQYLLGIASVLLLEILLTIFSIITANFRKNDMAEEAVFVLFVVIAITAYNSYMIQSINQFYTIKFNFSALLTFHLLNIASVVLIEAIAYIQAEADKVKEEEPIYVNKYESQPQPQPIATVEPAPVKLKPIPIKYQIETQPTEPKFEIIKPKTTDINSQIIAAFESKKYATQIEIAEAFGVSKFKVNRILKNQ
jgi:hypothetical protein